MKGDVTHGGPGPAGPPGANGAPGATGPVGPSAAFYQRTVAEVVAANATFVVELVSGQYGVVGNYIQIHPLADLVADDANYVSITAERFYISAGVVTLAESWGIWTTQTNGTPSSPDLPTPDAGATGDWIAHRDIRLSMGGGQAFNPSLGEFVRFTFTPVGSGVIVPAMTIVVPYQ